MNPFNNNTPNLNSSDRIRDKKSKYIYAAAKQKFQTKRSCNNKNIKYYKNGTVRSTANYKIHKDLARGNVLCEDCNNRGMLCGNTNKDDFAKIGMGNNAMSEFWGGGSFISFLGVGPQQTIGFPVVQADISGIWGGSATDISKSIIGPNAVLAGTGSSVADPSANMPYGYINNLIKIPRNLDGIGIIIDPSNLLFPSSNCGQPAELISRRNLKTYIVIRGAISIHTVPSPCPPFSPPASPFFTAPNICTDPSYNLLVGSFAEVKSKFQPVVTGVVELLCCVREQYLNLVETDPISGCDYGEAKTYGIFDVYISLIHLSDNNILSKLVNTTPIFNAGSDRWEWGDANEIDLFIWIANHNQFSATRGETLESIRIFQGTCDDNQTTGNKTKQSYMYCLEDGTKKVNFTK